MTASSTHIIPPPAGVFVCYVTVVIHRGYHVYIIRLTHDSPTTTITHYSLSGRPARPPGSCVRIWARLSRELLLQFVEHRKAVTQLVRDVRLDHIIHSCGADRAIYTYNIKKEQRTVVHQLSGASHGSFTGMAQRVDSEQELVTCSTDGVMYAWDCDVPDPVDRIDDPNRIRLNCISMSPSGRFVAVCGEDHQVKVFDVQRRDHPLLAVGLGHSGAVRRVDWSPDEKQLVSVGDDCCICVWNWYDLSAE